MELENEDSNANENEEEIYEASAHAYLGKFSYSHSNRHFFGVDEVIRIPLILFNELVLFPGDTLPLRIQQSSNDGLFLLLKNKVSCQSLKVVGIVTKFSNTSPSRHEFHYDYLNYGGNHARNMLNEHKIPSIGVTLEVSSFHMENENEIVIVGKSRQRFNVLEITSKDKVSFGKVQILSDNEPVYPPYLENHHLVGNNYLRNSTSFNNAGVNPFPQWVCIST